MRAALALPSLLMFLPACHSPPRWELSVSVGVDTKFDENTKVGGKFEAKRPLVAVAKTEEKKP